ncbi:MAG: FmdB family zinc ribbon protein [Clostridiaceae bacterium]|nr:FmdB family zinc ribbon protein [Clostridiaceae bacterium]
MPYYDLVCEDCGKTCNLKASITERTAGRLICPSCGSHQLAAVFSKVNVLHYHNKDCDVCPSSAGSASAGCCCGGSCAHHH